MPAVAAGVVSPVTGAWWGTNAWVATQATTGTGVAAAAVRLVFGAGQDVPYEYRDARTWNELQAAGHMRPAEAAEAWKVVKAMREMVTVRPEWQALASGLSQTPPRSHLAPSAADLIWRAIAELVGSRLSDPEGNPPFPIRLDRGSKFSSQLCGKRGP